MIEQQLDVDLKAALLGGDKVTATTIRGLKSTLLYAKVAAKTRDTLPDEQVIEIFRKEAKKRQESADLFRQGGNQEKAEAELAEKQLIEKYLPAQLDDEAVASIVDEVIAELGATDSSMMGRIIGGVKAKTGAAADGSVIARIVKEKLSA